MESIFLKDLSPKVSRTCDKNAAYIKAGKKPTSSGQTTSIGLPGIDKILGNENKYRPKVLRNGSQYNMKVARCMY